MIRTGSPTLKSGTVVPWLTLFSVASLLFSLASWAFFHRASGSALGSIWTFWSSLSRSSASYSKPGVRGSKPNMTLKGDVLMALCSAQLYVNCSREIRPSHSWASSLSSVRVALKYCPMVLLNTSAWPFAWGWKLAVVWWRTLASSKMLLSRLLVNSPP